MKAELLALMRKAIEEGVAVTIVTLEQGRAGALVQVLHNWGSETEAATHENSSVIHEAFWSQLPARVCLYGRDDGLDFRRVDDMACEPSELN